MQRADAAGGDEWGGIPGDLPIYTSGSPELLLLKGERAGKLHGKDNHATDRVAYAGNTEAGWGANQRMIDGYRSGGRVVVSCALGLRSCST